MDGFLLFVDTPFMDKGSASAFDVLPLFCAVNYVPFFCGR